MKDPADKSTRELAWAARCEQAYRDSYGALGGLIAQHQATQAVAPKPKRGVSKNASKSADQPERSRR